MANQWYISSAANAALTAWSAGATLSVGAIRKRATGTTYGTIGAWRVSAITTGVTGGSEPTWNTSNNGTVVDGGVTWTNVTGQSTYGWGAAAGDIGTLAGVVWPTRLVAGDTAFASSDHSQSSAGLNMYSANLAGSALSVKLICVNRSGSVPPVDADVTTGATFTSSSGTMLFDNVLPFFADGCTFSTAGGIQVNNSGAKSVHLKNCAIIFTGTGSITANNPGAYLKLENTTVQCGSTANSFTASSYGLGGTEWINTPSAIVGGTLPTTLFTMGAGGGVLLAVTARGVDFSALTSSHNLVSYGNNGGFFLFDSCKINSGVTRYNYTGGAAGANTDLGVVELVNCYDGTNIINERYQGTGTLTTERTIYLSSGAADDVGGFSHKIVTTANVDKFAFPFPSFWLDVEQSAVGSSQTATVEIISSASLNNDEIALYLQYQGTSSSPISSFADSFIATPLSTPAAVTSSSATWASSPSTPVKQKLQVTFTPQTAGRLRGIVKVGKASTTVYLDPRIVVT